MIIMFLEYMYKEKINNEKQKIGGDCEMFSRFYFEWFTCEASQRKAI